MKRKADIPKIIDIEEHGQQEEYLEISLRTARGQIEAHYYSTEEAESALLMVGGTGGGFDTPAQGLYPRLGERFLEEGIASLRVQYRHSTRSSEALYDVLTGIEFLKQQGAKKVVLIGHSLGGAVVINAGIRSPLVAGVIALSPRSYGTERVAELAPRPLLLVHGSADDVLPDRCSKIIYDNAREPKQLELFTNSGHVLDEDAAAIEELVYGWVKSQI